MDLIYQTCIVRDCGGMYIETSIHDDMDGVLHCDICNNQIKRYREPEDDGCDEFIQLEIPWDNDESFGELQGSVEECGRSVRRGTRRCTDATHYAGGCTGSCQRTKPTEHD